MIDGALAALDGAVGRDVVAGADADDRVAVGRVVDDRVAVDQVAKLTANKLRKDAPQFACK